MRARDGGTYYGWRIVAVAFLTHCLSVGCGFYSFGVFFTPLLAEFGWSRAQLSWGFSSISIFGALYSPIVGRVVDRYGPRPSQLAGVVVLGGTLMLLAGVHSLLQHYLPFARVPAIVVLFVLVYGYAMGGNATLQATILGWILDRTGTYLPAIALIFVLTLAAALCISRLRVPGHARAHSPGTGELSSV